ncbi:MAG: hypothetical protein HYY16_17120 [Planctomycetes bacterium]|nr:hypothetical protein [Planctomycetota bacterium]
MIRTREEALDALAQVLNLDRRQQIVKITVYLAQCLTPETRQILFRAQEGLVEGRLETRVRERVAPEPETEEAQEKPITEDRVHGEIVVALEALKVAAVVFDVFPSLGTRFARWEVARAALHFPQEVRRLITEGTDKSRAAAAEQTIANVVTRFRPWWHAQLTPLSEVCNRVWEQQPQSPWRVGAKSLLDIVATTELRAMYAAKDTIPNQQAMFEPLTKICAVLQRVLSKAYPTGLPPESALAE